MGRFDLQTLFVPLIAVAIGPIYALITGDAYVLHVFERALIFAVAAASLNLILGFGGMVSFGHAVFIGLGAYATGILSNADITSLWVHVPFVLAVCAVVALVIGLIVLRTTGVHFIMITLALAQIFYYTAVSSSKFGGDDGLVINERSTFFGFYDPWSSWHFYGFIASFALVLIWITTAIINSDFGLRLLATRENSQRAGALGFHVFGTRLLAFVLSGMICGLAGLMLANQSEFATPGYASWQRSGELLAIVILGGVGLRMGAVYGAFAFVLLEHALASFTNHWPFIFGPVLILVVLFLHRGVGGWVERVFHLNRSKTPDFEEAH
ncbi:branched-chain amino acid ABC transporter permease [Celeribacter halophilus]|uniref:branched-chain amino acid ABC transporter permease n=1 Tax=Celeribacter halophilus TaxID=576117 RepID=UPI001C089FF6|nr:branched-chain amino acid ABC transporter permease [Celeribacter halophilus]MBU2891383.1 branched-chain amino acid ABC transporter permease [Celeribacter halophilus]MDO6512399.1 branched-chain amino acid ABC transporter permease [Celeribacter halophilus]